MKRHKGYQVITDPGAPCNNGVSECDIVQCHHCEAVIHVKPYGLGDEIFHCTCCDYQICKNCAGKPCRPMEVQLHLWETRRNIFECS